jgi:hypothetical protein
VREVIEAYEERGFACPNDCVGFCSCSPCIACGALGQWTVYVQDTGFVCDECDRRDHPERYEGEDEDGEWWAGPPD